MNDQTVASALQSKLGAGALVACREKDDDWLCDASLPPRYRPACGALGGVGTVRQPERLANLVVKPRCSAQSQSPVPFLVSEGDKGPVAASSAKWMAGIAHLERLEMLQLEGAEESWAGKALDRLLGR